MIKTLLGEYWIVCKHGGKAPEPDLLCEATQRDVLATPSLVVDLTPSLVSISTKWGITLEEIYH